MGSVPDQGYGPFYINANGIVKFDKETGDAA